MQWCWCRSLVPLEHAAVDKDGGLLLVFDAYLDPQNTYHPASIRRLDGATGGVTWEYLVIGSVSKVAVHPDGKVFTSEWPYYGVEAYLTAIHPTGLVQKWPLPKGHYTRYINGVKDVDGDTQPNPSPPLVLEDGSVIVVSRVDRGVRYFIHDYRGRLILDPDRVAANSHRSFVTVTRVPSGAPQPLFHEVDITAAARTDYPEWSEDLGVDVLPRRTTLFPDGNGSLLLGNRESPIVDRIYLDAQGDYVMAPPQRLLPWQGSYHVEYLLGEDGAHALALGATQTTPNPTYWAHYVVFNPQTLAVQIDGPLGVGTPAPRHLQLQFAVVGGGAYISGPTDSYVVNATTSAAGFVNGGLATEVLPGFWNGWHSDGLALVMGGYPAQGVTDFPFAEGNSQGARAVHRFFSNFNQIEIETGATPQYIFDTFLRTFRGVNNGQVGRVTQNGQDPYVTAVGQRLTFSLLGVPQPPFSVDVIRLDAGAYTISVATVPGDVLDGHPLYGWRYWKVFASGPMNIVVETGSMERPANQWDSELHVWRWVGFVLDRYVLGNQLRMWEDMLKDIVTGLNNDVVPGTSSVIGGRQKMPPPEPGLPSRLEGRWDWMDKEYIRQQICGPGLLLQSVEICRR
jgi:hypothetical protein